jgi:hypothetical protein
VHIHLHLWRFRKIKSFSKSPVLTMLLDLYQNDLSSKIHPIVHGYTIKSK